VGEAGGEVVEMLRERTPIMRGEAELQLELPLSAATRARGAPRRARPPPHPPRPLRSHRPHHPAPTVCHRRCAERC
jgi:hypothetical protein